MITETTRPGAPTELQIRTLPDEADVILNGRYVGRTPLTVRDLPAGSHRLTISKAGFANVERWIRLRGGALVEVDVVLEQLIGVLALTLRPEDAAVTINGLRYRDPVIRMPVGEYTLSVRRFGYRDHHERIVIVENRTVVRQIELEPAPFEIERMTLSRTRFNPRNPGVADRTTLTFDVSAAGEAELSVRDEEGREVFRRAIAGFSERRQRVTWDGRNQAGTVLGDGDYFMTLEARSADGQTRISRTLPLEIDGTLTAAYRSTRTSSSGALFAPDAMVLSRGGFQLSATSFTRVLASADVSSSEVVPAQLGFRLGLGSGLEAAATADAFLSDTVEASRIQAGVSLRWLYADAIDDATSVAERLLGAVQLSLVVGPTTADRENPHDATTNWPGIRLALPVGVRFGLLRLILTPELVASTSFPRCGGESLNGENTYLWAYGRAALILDRGGFSGALSAAMRSEPFSVGLAPDAPLYAAIEGHQFLPGSPVALSLALGAELRSTADVSLSIGAGLGIFY